MYGDIGYRKVEMKVEMESGGQSITLYGVKSQAPITVMRDALCSSSDHPIDKSVILGPLSPNRKSHDADHLDRKHTELPISETP